ncbi:MAG: ORF6N domain-containing protein [Treponema sp.]|nr:ORF6N domain-containing protein [Treponema sp.]
MENELIPIQKMIYEIRGKKVMLDSDLADLYEIPTHRLNEAVKRNMKRFPEDFMFQLTEDEWENLRSQFAISRDKHGGRRYLPLVFTEHGILMLSSVLNSDKAIEVNIQIMKIFVHLRQYALSQNDTSEQIVELRKLLMLHIENCDYRFSEHDKAIKHIIQVLNNLIDKPKEAKTIGFRKD